MWSNLQFGHIAYCTPSQCSLKYSLPCCSIASTVKIWQWRGGVGEVGAQVRGTHYQEGDWFHYYWDAGLGRQYDYKQQCQQHHKLVWKYNPRVGTRDTIFTFHFHITNTTSTHTTRFALCECWRGQGDWAMHRPKVKRGVVISMAQLSTYFVLCSTLDIVTPWIVDFFDVCWCQYRQQTTRNWCRQLLDVQFDWTWSCVYGR